MTRQQLSACLLAAAAALAAHPSALASTPRVWLSLNLEFNAPGDFNSGGTWTAVAKADPQGIAGVNMYLANTNFGSFLAPPQLEVRSQGTFGLVRNVLVGDDLMLPLPLGIGVIGSSFPSTYVDAPGLIPYFANPDFGSFTGGVALATGAFNPSAVPFWTSQGVNVTDTNIFVGTIFPGAVIDADSLLTVRYVVPEPATSCLMFIGSVVVAIAAIQRHRRLDTA